MNLNVLVRGQSNAILMMESGGWAGQAALQREVQRLLGFDGANDTVSLIYDRYDPSSSTAVGGTALIGDWLQARNGDWRQGWTPTGLEQGLFNRVDGLPATQKDDPTATLWMHSEDDSTNGALTVEQWVSAVRFDAAHVRAVLGQGPETTPYHFVSAMPYWGTTSGHNAIRQGMEQLAAEGSFNAEIAARALDTDIDNDDLDGNHATREYGGPHMDAEDGLQTVMRAARSIAESFAQYAKPGSPVAMAGGNIADAGPQVIHAELVGTNQLRIDVAHDVANRFQALDADAARGVGWSVLGAGGQVTGEAAQIVDGDTLLVTFSGPVAADGVLHYGYGYGRLAGTDGSGRGNAVYDSEGLPIWVAATGLKVGTTVTPAEHATAPAPGPAPAPSLPPATAGIAQSGTAGTDTLRGNIGADTLDGGPGNDLLQGGARPDILTGGDGFDTLVGGGGRDVLNGGAGNDALRGGAGDDVIVTGAGMDRVFFGGGDGADTVSDFTLGTDRIQLVGVTTAQVTATARTVGGVSGLELRLPGGETLFIEGAAAAQPGQLGLKGAFAGTQPAPAPGAPSLPTTGGRVDGTPGDDWLKGLGGAELLLGGEGSDDLQGLNGDDVLRGGRDHDGLTGGAGVDTFVFGRGDGYDWVVDFQPGIETIWLEGIGPGQVAQTVESRWGMTGLQLDFGGGDEMFLQGVTQQIAQTDFVFA
jgi:Ca2+-binding RTX toxin-like protein